MRIISWLVTKVLIKYWLIIYYFINMIKYTFYISAPFDTYSGYGALSRDLIKAKC